FSPETLAKKSKPVKCVETGEIFPSIRAAAESCNVASSNMTMLLHGKGRTLGGFHWIFYDPENEAAELERIRQMPEGRKNTPESIEKMRKAKLGKVLTAATREKMRQAHSANPCKGWTEETIKKLSREIICIETGEIFPSIKAAAEKYNLKASNISAVLAGNKNTAGGFHWKYADGGTAQYRPDSMRRKNSKPVICVETGEIFPSVKAAAESVGFTYTAIAMVVNGEREKSGGYHWKYYFENDDENLAEMI
ncbi:MAG: hypothetical protein IJ728_04780, partial [Selenomonadaceae bacterium]|nr:hypothetical protein [Selenomonadaceae bacterium]